MGNDGFLPPISSQNRGEDITPELKSTNARHPNTQSRRTGLDLCSKKLVWDSGWMLYCLVGNLQSTLWHQIRLKSRAGSNSSPFVSLTLQTCVIRIIPNVADSWYLQCANWILARTQAVWQTQKVSKQARFGWGVSSMNNMLDDTAITSCNSCDVCWWCLVLWMYWIHSRLPTAESAPFSTVEKVTRLARKVVWKI